MYNLHIPVKEISLVKSGGFYFLSTGITDTTLSGAQCKN